MPSQFLQNVRSACRSRNFSYQTDKTYSHWIRRFIFFVDKKHPEQCGEEDVEAFLTYLAEKEHVAVNTQKLALNALVFVYRHVVKQELGDMGFSLATKQRQLPVVLSRVEISVLFSEITGRDKLIFQLLYGSGLRISECLKLRIKDVDFDKLSLTVVNGKGRKNRQTLLAKPLVDPLRNQVEESRALMKHDASKNIGVAMDVGLNKKYPSAKFSSARAFVFPSSRWCEHPFTGEVCRFHLHLSAPTRTLRKALKRISIAKKVSCHTFRHYIPFRIMSGREKNRAYYEVSRNSGFDDSKFYPT